MILTEEGLRSKAREWAKMVVHLHNLQVPPSLQSKKDSLLSFAKKTKDTIEGITGSIPELEVMDNQTDLGFVPLLIGAGIAGAAAAITYWITDYKKFLAEVEAKKMDKLIYDDLINQGNTPEKALSIIEAKNKKPISTKQLIAFGIAGLVASIFLLKRGR